MRSKAVIAIIAVVLLAPLVFSGCRQGADLELSKKFQAAQKAFDEASSPDEFLKVAALYQEIRDIDGISGAVLYNQGNAFMRAGRRGRAIAAYRQAERYRPNDPYLEANLRYALAAHDATPQRRPVVEYLLFWQDWCSYPAKFYLAAAVTIATFILGLISLLTRRRLFTRLAIGGVVLVALLVFSAGYDWYRYDHLVHGVVVEDEVVARKGNGAGYEPAFTEPLPEGTEFRVVNRRGKWLLIRLPGDQEGWIEQGAAVVY